MSDFRHLVHKAVSDHNMLSPSDSVIIALSGGADSVSLLHILCKMREELSLNLYAAHLNHNLRGEEAVRDESFCKILCKNYNVELFTKSVDIKALSEQKKISAELCGRLERYKFFEELSFKLNAKIATAHTASDNAETVIFNLIRGAGLKGMTGIAPVRDNIIRPLIYVTRAEVEAYCAENKLDFVTDSTNLSDDYTRNKIRHNIVTACREINPGFEKNITNNSSVMRGINSFLELKTSELETELKTDKGYSCDKIDSLPDGLRNEFIKFLLEKNNIETDFKTIKLLSQTIKNRSRLDINNSVTADCKQGFLRFIRTGEKDKYSPKELKSDVEFIYSGKKYSFSELKPTDRNILIRTRSSGDSFTFTNRKVTKSLKKLFIEEKIPRENRDSLILAADGNTVLWLEGFGFSKQGKGLFKVRIEREQI